MSLSQQAQVMAEWMPREHWTGSDFTGKFIGFCASRKRKDRDDGPLVPGAALKGKGRGSGKKNYEDGNKGGKKDGGYIW